MSEHYELVATPDALERCTEEWLRMPAIAMDTEFERQQSFYPVPALVQFSNGSRHWLLDPLALSDMNPLVRLLRAPDTVKVIHACSEDLQVLQQLCGVLPDPVFDTQIAAALLGEPIQTSYSKFVRSRFGVCLADDQTRSDWLRRPLSADQLRYAVEDVRWLLPLYKELLRELQALGRLEWLQEDCARLAGRVDAPASDASLLRKIKGGARLRGRDRILLLGLCRWRDHQARRSNRIRKRVLSDERLLEIAQQCPGTERELKTITGRALSGTQRRQVLELCAAHERDAACAEALEQTQARARSRSRALCRELQAQVAAHAQTLGIEAALLMSRDECREVAESVYGSGRLPEKLQDGWRRETLHSIFSGFPAEWSLGPCLQ